MKKYLPFVLILFCIGLYSQEKNDISTLSGHTLKNAVRFNFIPVGMPREIDSNLKPTMGLLGVHYQIPINNWLYGGVGMHAAITGDQGGLFTLGAELGISKKIIRKWFLDANVHFGGGGGYRYLVNDGAFLNANIGIKYQHKKYAFGVQFSHLDFYTGEIKSDAVSLFLQIPSVFRFVDYKDTQKEFTLNNQSEDNFWKKPSTKNAQQVRFDFFKPIGNSRKDNQEPLTETLYVLGFEYQKYISKKSFLFIHTDAIYKGLRAGFMDLFFGAGSNIYQSKSVNIFTKFAVGAAGGRVAPEGGLMIYPSAGVDLKLTNSFAISSHLGYYRAIAGDLEAYTGGFGLKYFSNTGGTETTLGKEYKKFKTQGIHIQLQNQTYLDVQKTDSDDVDLQLLGLRFNYDLNNTFYLIGEAGFAYKGESGGYAHGIVGLGISSPTFLNEKLKAHLEFTGGAAGGAGVDTEEGIVIRPTLGFSYQLANNFSLYASGGKMISPSGNLNTTNINVGLSFGLATLRAENE